MKIKGARPLTKKPVTKNLMTYLLSCQI